MDAVMRAFRSRLPRTSPLATHRFMATQTWKRPPPRSTPKSSLVTRFIPDDAKKFITSNGKLLTTKDNEAFFLQHGLEPDHGTMVKLSIKGLGSTTTAAFSSRHVISPYHFKYFDPRGHPLASAMRQKYARKMASEPLWVMTTVAGAASPVVRATAARKLKRALAASLEQLGYDELPGQGKARQIRGTLWLTILNPLAVLTTSEDKLGPGLASLLHGQYSSPVE